MHILIAKYDCISVCGLKIITIDVDCYHIYISVIYIGLAYFYFRCVLHY